MVAYKKIDNNLYSTKSHTICLITKEKNMSKVTNNAANNAPNANSAPNTTNASNTNSAAKVANANSEISQQAQAAYDGRLEWLLSTLGDKDHIKLLLSTLGDKDHILGNYKINRDSLVELLQQLVQTHKSTKDSFPKNPEGGKAVIYCRKSTTKGMNAHVGLQELPLATQEALCREYCLNHNLTVTTVVHEITSARNMDKMTKLNELVTNLAPGTVLLVADVSRFSRNVFQALGILNELSQKQVSVHAVNPNCTFDEQSINKFQFRSHLNQAELESDVISDRMKKSINTRKKMGGKIGKSKFGFECYYDARGLRRERENKSEQEIMKIISDQLDDENTAMDIALYLNDDGKTYRGKAWTPAHIRRIAKQISEPNAMQQKPVCSKKKDLRPSVKVRPCN